MKSLLEGLESVLSTASQWQQPSWRLRTEGRYQSTIDVEISTPLPLTKRDIQGSALSDPVKGLLQQVLTPDNALLCHVSKTEVKDAGVLSEKDILLSITSEIMDSTDPWIHIGVNNEGGFDIDGAEFPSDIYPTEQQKLADCEALVALVLQGLSKE